MKKIVFLFFILIAFLICNITADSSYAAKKATSKKSGISATQMKEMSEDVDYLKKKLSSKIKNWYCKKW